MGMVEIVWVAGPSPAVIPSEGKTRTHMTPRDPFSGGAASLQHVQSKAGMCYTDKEHRPAHRMAAQPSQGTNMKHT